MNMSDNEMFLPMKMLKEQMIVEVEKCNEYSVKFGVKLSNTEIQTLVTNRFENLKSFGRIEFGGGILEKLIFEFCDSPYIMQDNYMDSLLGLQEAFYYFKNESLDELSDDELIHIMKEYFDKDCQGSIEYLQGSKLEDICRDVRYRKDIRL